MKNQRLVHKNSNDTDPELAQFEEMLAAADEFRQKHQRYLLSTLVTDTAVVRPQIGLSHATATISL